MYRAVACGGNGKSKRGPAFIGREPDASNNKTPKIGALAAVANHSRWLAMHEGLAAVDAHNDANYTNGNSRVLRREATRLVSVSQPFADGWLTALPDGTKATALDSGDFVLNAQRRLGLHLSSSKATLVALAAHGVEVDFFGDASSNAACQNRRHRAALDGWEAASRAVSHGPVIMGDKDDEKRRRSTTTAT